MMPGGHLRWYYDKIKSLLFFVIWMFIMLLRSKNTFIFSSDFETMFAKHAPSEILNLNFKKMTVYLTAFFRFNSPPSLHQKG